MTDLDQKTIEVVNQLFEKIVRIKPAFKQAWPTEHEFNMVKREWVASFKKNDIDSINQIKKGYEKLRDSPSAFIPSPGEFLEFCKLTPEDIQAPSIESAYQEACKKSHPCYGEKTWSHPAVKHAYLKSDPFFLRNESINKTKHVFEKSYLQACEDYAKGRNMNQIEQQSKDTPDNRMKYQEIWGSTDPGKRPTYEQWLSNP